MVIPIKIIVYNIGLPLCGRNRLAMDTTLASPLTREGVPRQRGGPSPRQLCWMVIAGNTKHTQNFSDLVVLGLEVGGRWSQEAASFITLLAQHEARQAPPILQHSITTALIARWSSLLTHAAQQTFAASLVETPQTPANHTNTEGNEPTFSQLLAEAPPKPLSQPAPTTVSTQVPKRVWIYALPKAHLEAGQIWPV